jgi:hypothetical protein
MRRGAIIRAPEWWSARRVYASPAISEYFAADLDWCCGGRRAIRAVTALSCPHGSAESICHAAAAGQQDPSPPNFFAQNPNAKEGSIRGLNPRTLKRLNPFVYRPNDLYALEAPQGPVRLAAPGTLVAHNDERCYAIRGYRFSRVAPESDATKLSGSSTCEPAGQVRLKGATALAR